MGGSTDFGGSLDVDLQKHYDGYYDGPSEWRALGAKQKCSNITSLCADHPHDKVLEIGSGEGSILQRLCELNFCPDLYSLEISRSAINAITKRRIPSLRDVRHYNGYDIPYDDDEFDLAILSHVVEHLEHPRRLLREAGRVSKQVFIEVPLELTFRLSADYVDTGVGHINTYSLRTVRRLMQTCDLRILRQTVTNNSREIMKTLFGKKALIFHPLTECALKLTPRLAMCLFVYNCSILCEKDEGV
ncbi:MAG: class I SAM-dependent methyltransferase [Methanobacteriota archaeon]|nr:MAG: class I SAM-dependent methyltransferase [Euryarchaeota archaeon]